MDKRNYKIKKAPIVFLIIFLLFGACSNPVDQAKQSVFIPRKEKLTPKFGK